MVNKYICDALDCIYRETITQDLKTTCLHLKKSSENISTILESLSPYLVSDGQLFNKYLSKIILHIVSHKIPLKEKCNEPQNQSCNNFQHVENCLILSSLFTNPDILQYAVKYFQLNPTAPFDNENSIYNHSPKKRRLGTQQRQYSDYDIVKCSYDFLRTLPNEMITRWNWSKFLENYATCQDERVKWMVKNCITIIANMNEVQSKKLASDLKLDNDLSVKLTFEEEESTISTRLTECNDDGIRYNSEYVVDVNGIMIPKFFEGDVEDGSLVPVVSSRNNLRSLALAVTSGKAVCLLGPVGSGKTSLIENLAKITGRSKILKKVQLGDQTDSRTLLGTYHCTDIPGEFLWRPGILTEAVQKGHWLMLEDIDSAALDVASVLSALMERNVLTVPGYRDSLPVSPGFHLFLTQRTIATSYGFQKKHSSSSILLQKHITQISVEPLSRTELAEIIQKVFPPLTSICSRMIEVFMMFSSGSHDSSLQTAKSKDIEVNTQKIKNLRGNRLISTRDLLKWCSRSVKDYSVTSQESALKVLQDAFDIFTCSVPDPDDRLTLAKQIGTRLGIVEMKSEYYCKQYKPNISLKSNCIEIGRTTLDRNEITLKNIDFSNKQTVFSFTRPATCLLERIACCVNAQEPVLLVGETGTGKTSSVQYLAQQTGSKLVVINMNQQSDSADLLGGYKPVDIKFIITPIRYEYEDLFRQFFNTEQNSKFLKHIDTTFKLERWGDVLELMNRTAKTAISKLRKTQRDSKQLKRWTTLSLKLDKLSVQVKAAAKLTFSFIEGSLVKAMQEGHWVLLDEINLASAEILECLSGLLEVSDDTVELLEKGDKVPIKKHRDFKLFACMNPATDVGKKELPVGLRNRFTEFFIDELTDKNDLILLVGDYLYHMNIPGKILNAIYNFYINIRKEATLNLVDGSGHAPHYSLRTLCRALTAAARAKCGTVSRSLYEAFCLSFLTQLDGQSHPKVEAMIAQAVIGNKELKSVLKQPIPEPKQGEQKFLNFEGHWIGQGTLETKTPEDYVLTPTVRKNLRDIARVISLGKLPILLQGDTSVGKTSLITFIAKASGNYCVRINNHEHTDLQEYIGSYAADASGKLVFKEGVLVEAMKKGYWIILDELNLAPSDVLEALNRVLDDNRELYIPETQQVIKAHPNFILFATQNPPGLYGGRKMLSRAFRNRFVELHFTEIPRPELETILHQRCLLPPSYCKKMIAVMAELQIRRRGSATVQGKDGFITLRDLFRWGQRYRLASLDLQKGNKYYDWDQHIADEGYLVLAGKVRQAEERCIIEEVLQKHLNRQVYPDNLFSLSANTSSTTKHILEEVLHSKLLLFPHIVWTFNMRRLAVLIAKSFEFNEPVLLVGETGCGKTTICQILAALRQTELHTVNCHMHTESSDFLGGLRPVRQYNDDGKLFEWTDGPLIKAMQNGNIFLADEISLADDSVLERLNSLLEPERQLLLAEKGMDNSGDIVIITAHEAFHFIGTMNPGGDYGKKELSPALRNRFTEIWCDHVTSREDLICVLEKSVQSGISLCKQEDCSSGVGVKILQFTDWLKRSEISRKFPFSIRDLLSWVNFINNVVEKGVLSASEAYVHGACLTFLDCFGTAFTGNVEPEALNILRKTALEFLLAQIDAFDPASDELKSLLDLNRASVVAEINDKKFGIKPFYIETGKQFKQDDTLNPEELKFTFTAPTTGSNTLRLLRGMQLNKAILLEGNPGVGKTSLVTALAKAAGHKVVRINLSDQTDITDLFGTDLPTEEGSFAFKEGVFLTALKNGDWILLDELNLAPQPVLEGLNACLDHRGEIYVPELGKTFKIKHQTRIFACQNPLKQGGSRRGLPISFLNRFTQVYIDTLTPEDLTFIVETQYPSLSKEVLHRIVNFNTKVSNDITHLHLWGHKGGPWEMNLRDIQRLCDSLLDADEITLPFKTYPDDVLKIKLSRLVEILYINRMRSKEDKQNMLEAYKSIFHPEYKCNRNYPNLYVDEKIISIDYITLNRVAEDCSKLQKVEKNNLMILRSQLSAVKSIMFCVKMNWLAIIVGSSSTGKSSIVQVLADLTGNNLFVLPVTSAMDVTDLLGGYEQVDYNRNLENIYEKIEMITSATIRKLMTTHALNIRDSVDLLKNLEEYRQENTTFELNSGVDNEIELFSKKVEFLAEHCKRLLTCNNGNEEVELKCQHLLEELEKLNKKVSKVTSMNAGGRFEWVDSLLVKCLTEGHWLLLDNVNLTSAAVLDRLNSLLEANGVLNIPERGDMSEIKPHPNFRIFFTMDPKYGEISRAMRNRGVEIFLLKSEVQSEVSTEELPVLDFEAVLSSVGLPSVYHKICIDLHELMSSFVSGCEKPSISSILQAAHLTNQQITRGISYKVALINSFSDVYIKPRSGNDFATNVHYTLAEMKNNMLTKLKENIDALILTDYDDHQSKHTLSVNQLVKNTDLSIAKQHSFSLINQLLKTVEDPSEKNINLVLYALQICYISSNESTRKLLREYIIHNASKVPNYQHVLRWFLILHDRVWSICNQYDKTDYGFLIQVDGPTQCDLNSFNCNLYFTITTTLEQQDPQESALNAWTYSKCKLKDESTDDFAEFPILKYCTYYISLLDTYTKSAFHHQHFIIFGDDLVEFIQVAKWRERFIRVCRQPLFNQRKDHLLTLKEEILPQLYTHFNWVQKYYFWFLERKIEGSSSIGDDFLNLVSKCGMNSNNLDSTLRKLSKRFRKSFNQPLLYNNQEEYERSLAKNNLLRKLYKSNELNSDRKICMIFALEESANKINFELDVPSEEDFAIITKAVENCIHYEKDPDLNVEKYHSQVQQWPLKEYAIFRVLNLIKNSLFSVTYERGNLNNQPMLAMLKSVSETCYSLESIPIQLRSLLRALSNECEISERASALFCKFWDAFYKFQRCSAAFNPDSYLYRLESVDKTTENTLSENIPLLPYYVTKLSNNFSTFDSKNMLTYETVALENTSDFTQQMFSVQETIWGNMASLKISAYLKYKENATFEMSKFKNFLHCIRSATGYPRSKVQSGSNVPIAELITDCITAVSSFYTEKCDFSDHHEQDYIINNLEEASKIYEKLEKLIENMDDSKLAIETAKLSVKSSLLFLRLIAEISPVDPVERDKLKLKYIQEDIDLFDSMLSAFFVHGVVIGTILDTGGKEIVKPSDVEPSMYGEGEENRERLRHVHSEYCDALLNAKEYARSKIVKYARGNTFRPQGPSYYSFAKECKHFVKSILSISNMDEIYENLARVSSGLLEAYNKETINGALINESMTIVKRTETWLYSVNAFYNLVENEYSEAFPDLAKPLLTSLSEMQLAIHNFANLVSVLVKKNQFSDVDLELDSIMFRLIGFPALDYEENSSLAERIVVLFEDETLEYLLKMNENSPEKVKAEYFSLLKMWLDEVLIETSARNEIKKFGNVKFALNAIASMWKEQQKEIERKKDEEDSIYVTKSKCEDIDEDVVANEEIMKMFPSFSEQDFNEFKPPSLEQNLKPLINKTQCNKSINLITPSDITRIYKWHSDFIQNFANAEWLVGSKKQLVVDHLYPLLERFKTFCCITNGSWEALDCNFEASISPSLMLLLSHIKSQINDEEADTKPDFYLKPWVAEVKNCLPLLNRVLAETDTLLDQWPDFPTLRDIKIIANRILSFPVRSPIARFLTGLELLRDKIEEWNRNAHKGNNMIEVSMAVGAQIISWRKLEISHWRDCLNGVLKRVQSESHRFWFYLYDVVETCFNENASGFIVSAEHVGDALRVFMEESNLAEYEVRLNLVYTFHCHLLHSEESAKRNELISIMWNTYRYYLQFLHQVENYIKEKRTPIEKKLKDYVKICSWERDLSYWSVKDTVDKAHKVLHKHMKEFETLLKSNVRVCITIENEIDEKWDHIGIWDRPKRVSSLAGGSYMVEPNNYIAHTRSVKKFLEASEKLSSKSLEAELLQKIPNLFNKARTLCKDSMAKIFYPCLVQALDDFVTQVIETSSHLGSLDVDKTAPKSKQTSDAKNIQQQKRKALADLFRTLNKMGLSYRSGLVVLAGKESLYDFQIMPVDLAAALTYVKNRRADTQLTQLWTGCEMYYQRNIARHKFLTGSFIQPHQDLGLQNIERCKGYAAVLMKMTHTQKNTVAKCSRQLFEMRNLLSNMTSLSENDEFVNHKKVNEIVHVLSSSYSNTAIALQQFMLLLNSCPEMPLDTGKSIIFDSILTSSPIVKCYKNSDEWQKLYSTARSIFASVNKQNTALHKLKIKPPKVINVNKTVNIKVFSPGNIETINESVDALNEVHGKLSDILKEYSVKVNLFDREIMHPLLQSIDVLSDKLENDIQQIKYLKNTTYKEIDQNKINVFAQKSEDCVANLLLTIQQIYKRHVSSVTTDSSATNDNADPLNYEQNEIIEENIVENHLKTKLQESLLADIKDLQMDNLITKLSTLMRDYMDLNQNDNHSTLLKDILASIMPIVEQTVLLVQYFVTELVSTHRVTCKLLSILMKIFSDLASKGFCKPESLDLEDGEGDGGPGKLSSGTGLGEGEGQKDVSDKIENQDQLEDARKPGDFNEKEKDRDCKEEEKGVNMTDDFDSHLQDIDNKEDQEQSDDENDDADKQMGETGNAADKLDQQIWGTEDEESDLDQEESQKDSKKDEKGQGEKTGEKEMAAKEGDDETKENDGKEGKDKKDKKKDVNEMNEPEVDDDHVDPYHGNQPKLPEPEDFEMPDNMDIDEGEDKEEGETETENPFDIDVMKEAKQPDEDEDGQEKDDAVNDDKGKGGKDTEADSSSIDENEEKSNEAEQVQDPSEEMEVDEEKPEDELQINEDKVEETPLPEDDISEMLNQIPDKSEKGGDNQEDDPKEQPQDSNKESNPSARDPTAENQVEGSEMEKGTDDNVQTNPHQNQDEETAPYEQAQEQQGEESESKGRSELNKDQTGHKGNTEERSAKAQQSADIDTKKQQRRNRPGETREDRTLGRIEEPVQKKQKTVDLTTEEGNDDGADESGQGDTDADIFQHVQKASEKDIQALDAATKEQAEEQPIIEKDENPEESKEPQADEDIVMDTDEQIDIEKSEKEIKGEKSGKNEKESKDERKEGASEEAGEEGAGVVGEVPGEITQTTLVQRPVENTHHTNIDADMSEMQPDLSVSELTSLRSYLTSESHQPGEGANVWRSLWAETGSQARLLSERLRLVLEPTGRSRLAGEFRTGRRINMRRVIPYLASQFRKDRIWLRRTKPAKREYKIALALDDSSSMDNNRCKELAFKSLALISQALNLLESGELAVLSFGEKPNLLHPFSEQFSEHSGAKILDQLCFKQKRTKIAQLLDFSTVMFEEMAFKSDAVNAKLLVVVGDGRCIFSEGESKVWQSIRRARQTGIFIVYVIIDNPENKNSIMDSRVPIYNPTKDAIECMVSYLDTFPFPFYVIVRDISALPTVLGDALRQWFELATTS